MSGTLAMAQGSCEPPLFLDLIYHGGENKGENPVILVGSGIISSLYTANANRRCKPHEMVRMPGDIGGVAVTRAIAELKLPINLRMIIPLVENIQGCNFMQPGSRVILMGGSAVHIYGSEVAGQLVLAEALYYSNNFKPRRSHLWIPYRHAFGWLSITPETVSSGYLCETSTGKGWSTMKENTSLEGMTRWAPSPCF
uniref:Cytosol aminopeptidase domain-containing protein n=1 Tax=Timema douglasi TaxID=61478 RepID=A0A7R8VAZ9_TIMDO|nr:unnamed protein product [Timema douglasi]